MSGIGGKAMHGMVWFAARMLGQRVIRFVVTIILARLLMPEEFGLVAMTSVFIEVSKMMVTSGFGSSVVQRDTATHEDYNTLFWLNLVCSSILFLLIWLTAPLIATYFDESEIAPILRLSSLSLIVQAFIMVQGVQLQRELRFKYQAMVGLSGGVISAVVGVSMALAGQGVWSLIWMNLSAGLVVAVVYWVSSSWRPDLKVSRESLKHILSFGSPLLLVASVRRIFDRIPTLIIGKMFGLADLGFYNRGFAMKEIVVQSVTSPLFQVLFPTFSRIKHDIARLAKAYDKILIILSFVVFPVLFYIASVAEPLTLIVYGEKWRASAEYFYWLCLFAPMLPLRTVAGNVIKSLGKIRLYVTLNLLAIALIAIAIILSYSKGPVAIIVATGIAHCVNLFVMLHCNSVHTGLSVGKQMRSIGGPFIIALLLLVVSRFMYENIEVSLLTFLIMSAGTSFMIYILFSKALRLKGYEYTKAIIVEGFRSIRNNKLPHNEK